MTLSKFFESILSEQSEQSEQSALSMSSINDFSVNEAGRTLQGLNVNVGIKLCINIGGIICEFAG